MRRVLCKRCSSVWVNLLLQAHLLGLRCYRFFPFNRSSRTPFGRYAIHGCACQRDNSSGLWALMLLADALYFMVCVAVQIIPVKLLRARVLVLVELDRLCW